MIKNSKWTIANLWTTFARVGTFYRGERTVGIWNDSWWKSQSSEFWEHLMTIPEIAFCYSPSFLSTRNIQNYHFLENELVPEILEDVSLSIRRNLWIQLGGASHCAAMAKSALFMKMDRSRRINFLVSVVTSHHCVSLVDSVKSKVYHKGKVNN